MRKTIIILSVVALALLSLTSCSKGNIWDPEWNLKNGEEFLKKNAQKEGVVTRKSGLQYKIITEGSGEKPKSSSTVECHYKGWFVNGDKFDGTKDTPAQFAVSNLIPGFSEALKQMPVGSVWEIYVPYKLGYGAYGTNNIPPYSALIFRIELLRIVK